MTRTVLVFVGLCLMCPPAAFATDFELNEAKLALTIPADCKVKVLVEKPKSGEFVHFKATCSDTGTSRIIVQFHVLKSTLIPMGAQMFEKEVKQLKNHKLKPLKEIKIPSGLATQWMFGGGDNPKKGAKFGITALWIDGGNGSALHLRIGGTKDQSDKLVELSKAIVGSIKPLK